MSQLSTGILHNNFFTDTCRGQYKVPFHFKIMEILVSFKNNSVPKKHTHTQWQHGEVHPSDQFKGRVYVTYQLMIGVFCQSHEILSSIHILYSCCSACAGLAYIHNGMGCMRYQEQSAAYEWVLFIKIGQAKEGSLFEFIYCWSC